MANPEFVDQEPLTIVELAQVMSKIEKRDPELGFRATKVKDFVEHFPSVLSKKQAEELQEKLVGLDLTRLKIEHITKIIDFLPTTLDDLKAVLSSYPLSLPKKDQESIIDVVKGFA